VPDQVGSSTYVAADLAAGLIALGRHKRAVPSVLHFANTGTASWFDLA
jgi:dTDP-4-dehydrorhamnose reductase